MRKARLLFLFALLMTAVTGAWADDWTDIIINGNMEGSDRQCFFVKENGLGSDNLYYARIQDGIGKEGSRAILVQSTGAETFAWDTQFFLRLPYELPAGTKYRLTFDYMANVECECDLQSQNEPAEYIIWYINEGQSSPACSFKTAWDTYDSGELTVPAACDGSQTTQEGLDFKNNFQTISFNMAKNQIATQFIIDNIKFEILSSVASGLTKSPAPRVLPQYPVEINSMAIMGDFLGKGTEGNWNMENAWALTKDDNIWKLTKEFTAEAKTYEYKVFANDNMDDFTYPVEAKGQFVISEAGNYILNIFADPEGNTVSVKAVAPVNYTVKLKDGVTDADKWTIAPAEAATDGVYEGTKVTLTYSGRLKVKGVKATSDAVPAAKPDLLPAVFTVDAGKTVKFSKGNLQATYNGSSWIWGFAEHQWDYIGNAAGNTSINGNGTVSANGTVDLFGWVGASSTWTGAAQYGISNSTAANNVDGYGNVAGEAQKVDWGATVGTGWRTLTRPEWVYLLSTRETGITVNGTDHARYTMAIINTDGTAVKGLIIFPDSYSGGSPAGVTWGTINAKSIFETTCTSCTSAGWTALEAAGCVFLPAAGFREESTVTDAGDGAGYWSSSSSYATSAFALYFESDYMGIQFGGNRKYGFSVRLVRNAD